MQPRTLSIIAGVSYLIIFFAAIFANFFALESLISDPLGTIQNDPLLVRSGIFAFLIAAVFDVVVAWALYGLYRAHPLSGLSSLFRMMHATIMGIAVFALPPALVAMSGGEVLQQVDTFNMIWLVGLFFFGVHLILLSMIIDRPKIIASLLFAAGIMYMVDTAAHFMLPDYEAYASVFLALVALPGILGEMSFSVWLLVRGGKG